MRKSKNTKVSPDTSLDSILADEPKRRKVAVIDIETYGNTDKEDAFLQEQAERAVSKTLKDPAKIEVARVEAWDKFALNPRTGRIIHVGFLQDDGKSKPEYMYRNNNNEYRLLKIAWETIYEYYQDGYTIVSKGGKRFDIPFLFKRAIINKVPGLSSTMLNDLLYKYNNVNHCDIETILEDGGLYSWAYLMGFTDQFKNNGNEIKAMYEAGDIAQIAEKNRTDLELTLKVFRAVESWIL